MIDSFKEFLGFLIAVVTLALFSLAWGAVISIPILFVLFIGKSVGPFEVIGSVVCFIGFIAGIIYLSRKYEGIDGLLGKILVYGLKYAKSFYGPVHRKRFQDKLDKLRPKD
ncbi:MAG: hypothetical protein COB46_00100 [Rhodospirillaceae bacterium]|nr:MAG: hypothetical protein COB46_00100 [Rhodospirillaceae bacterium]